jgi:SsrA-binding protein
MSKEKNKFSNNINIKNRRASFEYEFLDKYVAGMVLTGTEIKSIREGKVNLQDAFCVIHNEEIFARQMHISPYGQGTHYNHELTRERKLLLSKKEIRKLENKLKDVGLTIVPTRLFINDRGFAKLEIALAKGKKLHDKRESIKERDVKKEIARVKF